MGVGYGSAGLAPFTPYYSVNSIEPLIGKTQLELFFCNQILDPLGPPLLCSKCD